MAKIKINVHTIMNNNNIHYNINAIMDDYVIKYIDFDHNKFVIDLDNKILIKESNETIIKFLFLKKEVSIYIKELQKEFIKKIEILMLESNNKMFIVKYKLIDENIINEYCVKLL